jgi:hypothetical protein
MDLFWSLAHLHGGPAPVRRFLPELIDLIWNHKIDPGKVFDLELPLDQAADGYRAMDQREAIKVLLRPRAASPHDRRPRRRLNPTTIRMQITRNNIESRKGHRPLADGVEAASA